MKKRSAVSGPPKTTKKTKTVSRINNVYLRKKNVFNQSTASYARIFSPNWFKSHQTAFPQRMAVPLRYVNVVPLQAIAATAYSEPLLINANGAYDPEAGIVANQPAGFAKLMAIYTKCYVKAAKIEWRVTNLPQAASNPSVTPLACGIFTTTNTATAASFALAVQSGNVTYGHVTQAPDTKVFTQTVDIGKFVSVDDIMDSTEWNCTVASNPNQIVVFHMFVYNMSGVGANVSYSYTVDYDCVFTDPLPIV